MPPFVKEDVIRLDKMRSYDAQLIQTTILNDIASLLESLNENISTLRKDLESTFPKGLAFGRKLSLTTETTGLQIYETYGSKAYGVDIVNDGTDDMYYSLNRPQPDDNLSVKANQADKVIFPRATIESIFLKSAGTNTARIKFLL